MFVHRVLPAHLYFTYVTIKCSLHPQSIMKFIKEWSIKDVRSLGVGGLSSADKEERGVFR